MERLNEIFGRTGPRRQTPQENRSSQSQRPAQYPQAPQTNTRRPLPEQVARLGQKRPYAPQSHNPYASRSHNQSQQGPAPLDEQDGRGYPSAPPQSYARQRPTGQPYSSRPPYPQPERPRPKPYVPRPANDYYHTDDYGPGLPADAIDAIEDWEDDDANGMRYGDWEGDGSDESSYRQPDPRMSYSNARNTDTDLDMGTRGHPTRDLRTARLPAVTNVQSLPQPIPYTTFSRTQALHQAHRITQPLNPQAISNMSNERELVQHGQGGQRALRPSAPREPIRLPSANLSALPPRSICPKCKGAGFLRIDVPFGHPNFGRPVACECKEAERKEKRRLQLRSLSNLDAFQLQSFKTFNTRVPGVQEAYQSSVAFANDPHGWLLLIGPNGSGKTHLAVAIANQCLDEGAVVLFSVVPDLLDHLRAAFAPDAAEVYDQLFAKMREAELLVLDDLGAQQSSPWANEKLFQLLNYRYNLSMPTVITANQRGMQGVDERIRSRLGDAALVTSVILDRARDYRPHRTRR